MQLKPVRVAGLGNEDHVMIVLDTCRDGRSGCVFAVDPNGARYPGSSSFTRSSSRCEVNGFSRNVVCGPISPSTSPPAR